MNRFMTRIRLVAIAFVLAPWTAVAAPCPGNPNALGTERVIEVDARSTPRVGRKQFPSTLPLRAKELVLTFDDGPWPGTTSRVLDALKTECVRATFFLLGRNAAAHPQLARRALAEGHTRRPSQLLASSARPHGDGEGGGGDRPRHRGGRDRASMGRPRDQPATPFFRFPGFASNPALLDRMAERGIVVFGADVWASDWLPMTPDQELRLILSRIEQVGRGIVLFHDTKVADRADAAGLPARTQKARLPHRACSSRPEATRLIRRLFTAAHKNHWKTGLAAFTTRNPPLMSRPILSGASSRRRTARRSGGLMRELY